MWKRQQNESIGQEHLDDRQDTDQNNNDTAINGRFGTVENDGTKGRPHSVFHRHVGVAPVHGVQGGRLKAQAGISKDYYNGEP